MFRKMIMTLALLGLPSVYSSLNEYDIEKINQKDVKFFVSNLMYIMNEDEYVGIRNSFAEMLSYELRNFSSKSDQCNIDNGYVSLQVHKQIGEKSYYSYIDASMNPFDFNYRYDKLSMHIDHLATAKDEPVLYYQKIDDHEIIMKCFDKVDEIIDKSTYNNGFDDGVISFYESLADDLEACIDKKDQDSCNQMNQSIQSSNVPIGNQYVRCDAKNQLVSLYQVNHIGSVIYQYKLFTQEDPLTPVILSEHNDYSELLSGNSSNSNVIVVGDNQFIHHICLANQTENGL
ncbi:MAG: hypothetical protein ACON5A_05065 [Candidatus Comchoanobacterales bacterium]